MRHYTAGYKLLPHNIVISWYVTFSLEDATGGVGLLVAVTLGQLCGLLTFATCRTAPRNFLLYNHKFCNAGHCFAFDILHVSGHFFSFVRVVTPYLVGELIGIL